MALDVTSFSGLSLQIAVHLFHMCLLFYCSVTHPKMESHSNPVNLTADLQSHILVWDYIIPQYHAINLDSLAGFRTDSPGKKSYQF